MLLRRHPCIAAATTAVYANFISSVRFYRNENEKMAEKGSSTAASPTTRASASLTSSASVPLVLLGRPISEDGRAGYPDLFLELLRRAGCDFIWDKDVEADRSILGRVDAIICMFHYPKTLFDETPKEEFSNLKIISKLGAGVDRIDVAGWRQRGVVVTNTPEAVADATADLAVALALAAARRLEKAFEIVRSGDWSGIQLGVDVSGSVVGIVGMGNIGLKIAKRLRAFDAKILYHNRRRRPKIDEDYVAGGGSGGGGGGGGGHRDDDDDDVVVFCPTLEELCSASDFVIVACPLNEETRHLITHRHFDRMKKNAIVVNIARGQVIDQEALVTALTNRVIAGAALDVMTPEPLPRDHPLQRLDNCILTPHMGTATEGARRKMVIQAVENLVRGVRGEPLKNVV
jgi:glyoxylate reductase